MFGNTLGNTLGDMIGSTLGNTLEKGILNRNNFMVGGVTTA